MTTRHSIKIFCKHMEHALGIIDRNVKKAIMIDKQEVIRRSKWIDGQNLQVSFNLWCNKNENNIIEFPILPY